MNVEQTQGVIIRMQSEIIDGLYVLLQEHLSLEELEGLHFADDLRIIEELRREIE